MTEAPYATRENVAPAAARWWWARDRRGSLRGSAGAIGNEADPLERGQPIEQRVKDVEGLTVRGVLNPESKHPVRRGRGGHFPMEAEHVDHRPAVPVGVGTVGGGGAPEGHPFRAKPTWGTDRLRAP